MKLNEANKYIIRLAELVSGTKLKNLDKREIINKLNEIFGDKKYPGISISIKNKIRNNVSGFPFDDIVKLPPETFLNFLRHKSNIDFENVGLEKSETSLKKLATQYKESLDANVEAQFNGTIGVLVDKNGLIAINPEVKKILQDNLGLDFDDETINKLVKYHHGDGLPIFEQVYKKLIEKEEKEYLWDNINGTPTKSYFIPGGSSGLTIFRDYFLDEGTLVIVPNYRWPNIDGIVMNKTKIPPAVAKIFEENGDINFDSIDNILLTAKEQGRKRVGIYLNFPNNPTGLNFGKKEADKLNSIINKHSDLEINIAIDDPYGAFSLKDNLDVKTPISYLLDTENNKNATILELGSYGTKEAGVYGFRIAVMRGITNKNNKDKLEQKLSLAIWQTFSMSPSLPQVILLKAILGKDLDVFADKINLSENEINKSLDRYLEGRKKMSSQILDRVNNFRNDIQEEVGEYFNIMGGNVEGVNGFYLTFILSNGGKEKGINIEELRKICMHNTDDNGDSQKCSFFVFENTISGEQCMRISLISGDTKEYSKRLRLGLDKFIN